MGSFPETYNDPTVQPPSSQFREEEKILFSNLTANTMDRTTAVYKQILRSS